jgi:hypothetical protein
MMRPVIWEVLVLLIQVRVVMPTQVVVATVRKYTQKLG